jgi:hypothetical protein
MSSLGGNGNPLLSVAGKKNSQVQKAKTKANTRIQLITPQVPSSPEKQVLGHLNNTNSTNNTNNALRYIMQGNTNTYADTNMQQLLIRWIADLSSRSELLNRLHQPSEKAPAQAQSTPEGHGEVADADDRRGNVGLDGVAVEVELADEPCNEDDPDRLLPLEDEHEELEEVDDRRAQPPRGKQTHKQHRREDFNPVDRQKGSDVNWACVTLKNNKSSIRVKGIVADLEHK